MRGLLADINIQGQVEILRRVLEGGGWGSVWSELALPIQTFPDLNLHPAATDAAVWRLCQSQELLLLTGNRNKEGPDSLEATIERENRPECLPVLTFANPESMRRSRAYVERVADKLMDYVLYIDNYRGTGRLYLP